MSRCSHFRSTLALFRSFQPLPAKPPLWEASPELKRGNHSSVSRVWFTSIRLVWVCTHPPWSTCGSEDNLQEPVLPFRGAQKLDWSLHTRRLEILRHLTSPSSITFTEFTKQINGLGPSLAVEHLLSMDKVKPGMGGRGMQVPGIKVEAERRVCHNSWLAQGLGCGSIPAPDCLRRGAGAGATVTLGTGE